LAEFPPSPKSKFCLTKTPENLCEDINYSILTGDGTYFVRVNVGDPSSDTVQNLKINGKTVASNLFVPKGEMKSVEEVIEAQRGYLTFKSDCVENCDYAVTKMNSIEIMPFKDDKNKSNQDDDVPKKKLCGGGKEGGKCESGGDVLHCIYNDITHPSAVNCNGRNMLMLIPNDYKCKDQLGKYKCVKKSYSNSDECKAFCPQHCNKNMCAG
jgi:hypothetical protein